MGKDCSCEGEMTMGPYGIKNGNEWSYRPNQGGIKQIIITDGIDFIYSIKFKGNHDGNYSSEFGSCGNGKVKTIDIDFPSEFLTGISGRYATSVRESRAVYSLSFYTNKNQYGPFGNNGVGTRFSVNANGGSITGFHGFEGPQLLNSIGVYVEPLCSLSTAFQKKLLPEIGLPRCLPPLGSAVAIGGNGGREWDDGVFATVKGAHLRVRVDTGVLSAVQFSYLKNDGSDFESPLHGGDCGGDMHKKTILFNEKDEYLIGIEGFHGVVEGIGGLDDYNNVVKSLTFITNKTRYGPVGIEMGTYFTSMKFGDCNGKVVGFHGRSGAYLHSIGLHSDYNVTNIGAAENKVKEED